MHLLKKKGVIMVLYTYELTVVIRLCSVSWVVGFAKI